MDDSTWFLAIPGRWKSLPDVRFRRTDEEFYQEGSGACLRAIELSEHYLEKLPPPPIDGGMAELELLGFCDGCGAVVGRHNKTNWLASPNEGSFIWSKFGHDDKRQLQADHGHYVDDAPGALRFYYLYPTGPKKVEKNGTVIDLMLKASGFVSNEGPVPPLSVVNEMLHSGLWEGGMSGGVEFRPTQIGPEEYPAIRRELLERSNALHDLVVPPHVETHAQLRNWWNEHLAQFSTDAHAAWADRCRELMRKKPRDGELNRHLFGKLAFLSDFDNYQR